MSGCLESLANSLEVLPSLPTAMKWRGNWDVNEQYYINDVVRSTINGAEYILTGIGFQRGGLDPADLTNTTGVWTTIGAITNYLAAPTVVDAGAGAYTVTTADLPVAPANSRWLIVFNGLRTKAVGDNTVADVDEWNFVGPAGADTVNFDLVPPLVVGPPASNSQAFGFSGSLTVGNTAGPITVTANYKGTAFTYTGTARITYIRLA